MKNYWLTQNINKIEKKRKRIQRRINRGKYLSAKHALPAINSLYRAELQLKVTEAEKIFGDYLWNKGIRFQFQKGFFKPFHRIADFYIFEGKIIIEIDGGYHTDETVKYKDFHKDEEWKKRGYKTIRITNEEVLNGKYVDKL